MSTKLSIKAAIELFSRFNVATSLTLRLKTSAKLPKAAGLGETGWKMTTVKGVINPQHSETIRERVATQINQKTGEPCDPLFYFHAPKWGVRGKGPMIFHPVTGEHYLQFCPTAKIGRTIYQLDNGRFIPSEVIDKWTQKRSPVECVIYMTLRIDSVRSFEIDGHSYVITKGVL